MIRVDGGLMDAWHQDFRVVCKGDGAYAMSAGPDGRFHSEDDIR
ncbi:MAG: hypothetical protein AB8I08_11015 [Sandaracinaceae bacterium]